MLCVDNFFTGSKANVRHLLDDPNFELMRHDITFPLYVEVDRIFNFAARPRRFTINMTRSRRPR